MCALANPRPDADTISTRRVAVVWQRFGPYHLARLRGAAEVLEEHGVEVHGIEIAREDPEYRWDVIEAADEPFFRHTLFPTANYGDLPTSSLSSRLREALGVIDPDAVAINGWAVPEAQCALSWCRRNRRIPILMSETFDDGRQRKWWKEMAKSLIVRAFDSAVVGGEPHVAYAMRLGVPRTRIFKGYDVVDNDHFARGAERAREDAARQRAKYGLPERYFFANTRFVERKNVDGLLRAFAAMRADAPGWGLVISGSGEMEEPWKALAAQLGLDDVVWPGFLQYDTLPIHYGLASAFVHPAKVEPWGLVVNEAAATGLPLLVGDKVGARWELAEDGANGFLFDAESVESMAGALRRVATADGAARAAMGERSRAIAAQWTPRRFGESLAAAIEAAAATRRT